MLLLRQRMYGRHRGEQDQIREQGMCYLWSQERAVRQKVLGGHLVREENHWEAELQVVHPRVYEVDDQYMADRATIVTAQLRCCYTDHLMAYWSRLESVKVKRVLRNDTYDIRYA
jgi:hypothetical protein